VAQQDRTTNQGKARGMIPKAEDQPTMTVWPEAGEALGLSRCSTYAAVKRGEIPTLRIGKRLLVPTAAFRLMLGLDVSPGRTDSQPG
jgi:hypothetical protein